MQKTLTQYNQAVTICREIFIKKMKDYGSSWRILRAASVTDQISIKAQRIKSIEQKKTQLVGDDIRSEFIGIVNYGIMGLIQLAADGGMDVNLEPDEAISLYNSQFEKVRSLMLAKNHDYGEAWRTMRISSLTDLILMKIYRIKQIEDNLGQTIASEGIDANYMDIINYAIFALIKTDHQE